MKMNNNFNMETNAYMLEIINQYEGVIHKFVNLAKAQGAINAVCNEEDLLQEGKLALIKAYLTYDENKSSFSTHVYHCVRDAICEYKKKNLGHLANAGYIIQAHNNAKTWDVEELMKQGLSKKTALAASVYGMKPINYGEAFNMVDRKATAQLRAIENHYSRFDYAKYLTEREATIIEHYYGLNGTERLTMEEIGYIFGMSRKAVSYAINRALVKLRHADGIEEYAIIR